MNERKEWWESLHNDRYIARMIYENLRKEWPQINEQTRIAYTHQNIVIYAHTEPPPMFPPPPRKVRKAGIKARLYRAVGLKFKKQTWYDKGCEWEPRAIEMPPTYREEIQLKTLGWHSYDKEYPEHIRCGYHPTTDTLYISPRG